LRVPCVTRCCLPAEMRHVAFAYDPIHVEHDPGQHPENPERLLAVMTRLDATGVLGRLDGLATRAASETELTLVHRPEHVAHIRALDAVGGGWADEGLTPVPETIVVPGSFAAASHAAGAVLAGVDAVLGGTANAAFCLVRPPGHHATAERAMGFCLFNNIAVAARYAQRRHALERVAILDIDVHHGNGSQDIFWDDPSVLYISLHEFPFYPGSGHWRERGGDSAIGATVNIPLPVGSADAEYERAFDLLLLPLVRRFQPQLILVSAGYDAHLNDPLADMALSTEGYRQLMLRSRRAADAVCDGRIVVVLEGGYHPEALAACVEASLEVLLADPAPAPAEVGAAHPRVKEYLQQLRQRHGLAG
jgi:acetoin utilization deacetylase AcuC-like enzyme